MASLACPAGRRRHWISRKRCPQTSPTAAGEVRFTTVFATDEDAKVRAWALLAGPVLRMHAQPAFTHSGSSKRQKLLNLCWVPPIATVVQHYTGAGITCDQVLRTTVGDEVQDEAQDSIEMLLQHWDIDCCSAFTDGVGDHSGGAPSGWDETSPLYEMRDGIECVCSAWWRELAAGIASAHPSFLLAERMEAATVRDAMRSSNSYCHCLLVVGYEGSIANGPLSSDRRAGGARGAATSPRLLLKDPCRSERLLEASFEAPTPDCAVQLRVFFQGGRSAFDRYRVKGCVRFCGVGGAPAAPLSPRE